MGTGKKNSYSVVNVSSVSEGIGSHDRSSKVTLVNEVFDYSTIRVERGGWRRVPETIYSELGKKLAEGGGAVYGVWAGEVGFYSDEGAIMTALNRGVDHDDFASAPMGAEEIDGVLHSQTQRLVATVRPADSSLPSEDGLYVHRWFEIDASDWEEFLDLSNTAWPSMEAAFPGVRIVGFWKSLQPEADEARILLITRYEDLAQWEKSRYYGGEPVKEAKEAFDRFARRARLTKRSIARFTRLVRA